MYLYVADKQLVRWILWKCFQDADDNLWTCKRQPLDLWTTTFGLVDDNLWTCRAQPLDFLQIPCGFGSEGA